MACQNACSRRCFLGLVAVGSAAATLGVGCSSAGSAGPADVGDVSAGNLKDLAVGTVRAVGTYPVAIARDADGVYAMTLTCTHQGANMATEGSVSSSGISCSLHGSRFDTNGAVVQGPAGAALAHFAVEIDSAGAITVHSGTEVGASTRVPV